MLNAKKRLVVLVTVSAALSLSGCACGGRSVDIVDLQTDTFSIPTDSAQRAVIELDLGVGELLIEGGSLALCSGEIDYNVAEWKPVIEHSLDGDMAIVRVTQPSVNGRSIGSKARTHWALKVSDDIPAHLVIDIGVGESRIDLADAMVERIDVDAGVGEVVINVGNVRSDLTIDVDSGVGTVAIYVPDDVGVHVDCDRGIGSFEHSGLTRSHGGYVNAAYGESEILISIRVDSGVGEVRVVTGSMTASI